MAHNAMQILDCVQRIITPTSYSIMSTRWKNISWWDFRVSVTSGPSPKLAYFLCPSCDLRAKCAVVSKHHFSGPARWHWHGLWASCDKSDCFWLRLLTALDCSCWTGGTLCNTMPCLCSRSWDLAPLSNRITCTFKVCRWHLHPNILIILSAASLAHKVQRYCTATIHQSTH